jgi:hypothetical protein
MVDPSASASFDYAKTYAIYNVKCEKYIEIYNDSFMGMGGDGIRGVKGRIHGKVFRIVAK